MFIYLHFKKPLKLIFLTASKSDGDGLHKNDFKIG